MRSRLTLVSSLLLLASTVFAAEAPPARQPLKRSIGELHAMTAQSPNAADLWFDLGIAEATTGSLGQARFALERSLWLAPFDREARAARDLVTGAARRAQAERSGEKSIQQGEAPAIAWWRAAASLPLGLMTNLAAALSLALLGTYLAANFGGSPQRRERSRWAFIGLCIALPLLAGITLAAGFGRTRVQPAVVLTAAPLPRTGPDQLAARAKNHGIYEASLVAVLEERAGWCRVESATSADLWLPCEQLGRINAAAPQ